MHLLITHRTDEDSFLAYTQGRTIQRVNFPANSSDPTVIIYDQYQLGIGIAYDCQENSIYWSNIGGAKVIMKSDPLGGNSTVVVASNSSSSIEGNNVSIMQDYVTILNWKVLHSFWFIGIAIDSISRTIYWTDSGNDIIEVMKLDGTNRRILFDTDIINPRAIAIDPVVG